MFPNTKLHAKNQKKSIARISRKTGGDRETDRERDRDGPEYKGPPDAIAKPLDQKNTNILMHLNVSFQFVSCCVLTQETHRFRWQMCIDCVLIGCS